MTVRAVDDYSTLRALTARLRRGRRRLVFIAPQYLYGWVAADLRHAGLWTPAMIGLGAGLYFGLKAEPPFMMGLGALIIAIFAASYSGVWRKACFPIVLLLIGFVAADWRTAQVDAPSLSSELSIRSVTGRLISVEEGDRSRRLLIAIDAVNGLAREELPARARITWRGEEFDAEPGDIISLRAGLQPPPPPAAPGTFDFARQLYFQRIGAVGYAVTPPQRKARSEETPRQFAARIEGVRAGIFHRITRAAPGEGGAIIAAIVTGKRDAVTDSARDALRDAGLAHLLAISGLHMGLATGLIFFTIRLGLAAIEPVAVNFPVKKIAAGAALISGVLYLIISGSGWSARRAFIMAAIMFAAILVDRRALSLRNVAIAACFILLTTPEALFHPGFQMSFAAVTALIAAYELHSGRTDPDRSFSIFARLRRYAVGLAATDTIAALATAPFALYHFNRVALYSLPANVLAMPLMAFWIVPAAIMALILTPLGLDAWAWRLAALGVEAVLAIAREVSSWPGALSFTPQWPLGVLLLLTFGGLVLCLLRSPLRIAGLAAIPIAMIAARGIEPPQLYVAASGMNAGVFSPDERSLIAYNTRRDRFSFLVWQEAAGLDTVHPRIRPMAEAGRCGADGCVMTISGEQRVAFSSTPAALAEDCSRADLVVAFFPVAPWDRYACTATLIDRRSVWRRGAHAVWMDKSGAIKITTVGDQRGARPWTGAR